MKVLRVLEKIEDDGGMRVDILVSLWPVYMKVCVCVCVCVCGGGTQVGKVNRLGRVTRLSIIIISHFNLITFT